MRQGKIEDHVVVLGLLDLEIIFFWELLGESIGGVPTLTLVGGLRIAKKISWLRIFLRCICATRGIDLSFSLLFLAT